MVNWGVGWVSKDVATKWAWWCKPSSPATQEAEAGGSLMEDLGGSQNEFTTSYEIW